MQLVTTNKHQQQQIINQRAAAEILCCGDTLEKFSSSSSNSSLAYSTQATDFPVDAGARKSFLLFSFGYQSCWKTLML
jgi:hypothetical protein